ncbi:PAS domain S-box protein [Solidesulfovibrio magneticus]|uniref:PAS domain S-box protein n=1 Tax=Solidesulfovibrio magneticus TaxID=184917 RepID=UPI000306FB44|nr:PAS domain S-box protein [Solidesulfovibrio magneticus]
MAATFILLSQHQNQYALIGSSMQDVNLTYSEIEEELSVARRRVVELESKRASFSDAEINFLGAQCHIINSISWKNGIFNVPAFGILVVTKHRVITDVNSGLLEMLGYDKNDLIGNSVEMLHVNSDSFLKFGERYWSATAKQRIVSTEWPLKRKCGEVVWVKISGSALDAMDIGRGVVWVLFDVTDQKKAEIALGESEDSFRSFFESINDIAWVVSNDGKIVQVNHSVQEILGFSLQDILNMNVIDIHPENVRHEAVTIFADMLKGKRETCPLSLLKKDGSALPAETRIWKGRWKGQDCIFGISRDLTLEQEALQRFERLFNSNPAPMALSIMPSMKLIDVNNAFVEITRYQRDEVIGKTSDELNLFTSHDKYCDLLKILSKDGQIKNSEAQIYDKDGNVHEGIFYGEIIESQGQKFYLSVMVDITERKQIETSLQKLKNKYKNLIENSPIGIFESTPNGKYLAANPSLARIYGYDSAEDLINRVSSIESDIYVNESERTQTTDQLKNCCLYGLEQRRKRKDGTIAWVSLFMRSVRDKFGNINSYEGFVSDITDRKRAENELKESEEKFRLIVETSNQGIVAVNQYFEITYSNKIIQKLAGYSEKELHELHIDSIFLSCGEESFSRTIINATERSIPKLECRIRNKDGECFWVLFSSSPISRLDNSSGGAFIMITDISEQKNLELNLLMLATKDGLTGVSNRHHFMEISGALLSSATRYNTEFSVAIFDIDNFKMVNDTWGHSAGDMVLKKICTLATAEFRSSDIIGRLGGEEFAISMPETSLENAAAAVERFRTIVESTIFEYDEIPINITISSGVAACSKHTKAIDCLLKSADNFLYKAKRHGRNQTVTSINAKQETDYPDRWPLNSLKRRSS